MSAAPQKATPRWHGAVAGQTQEQSDCHRAAQAEQAAAPGSFTKRINTASAEVLCRLLSGETMTGMDGVFDASTTRLAAHIGYLETEYAWNFTRRERAVGCNDGRIAHITSYRLELATIASTQGAAGWCGEVRRARAALRAKADGAKREAERQNAALRIARRKQQPGQLGLFDESAA